MMTVKELIQKLEKLPPVEYGLNWWFEIHGETDEQRKQDKAVML